MTPDLAKALTPYAFIGLGAFIVIAALYSNADDQIKMAAIGVGGTAIGCAGGLSRNVPDSQNSISLNNENEPK